MNESKDKEKDHDRGVLSHLADAVGRKNRDRNISFFGEDFKVCRGSTTSVESGEVITIILETGEWNRLRQSAKDDQIGTQRVYKKCSPNSMLTLYLPTRELISCGTSAAILKGILFVDPKLVQGHRVYAQLTLTFRYGREDEEVMGLRFCNEAIMSLHQIWPRNEEPPRDSLTPLQDALIKRLGDGAHPFTLSLTPQAPPSVQLVPAKRYYGAPIGTSYDVRCFIADKSDEKFHRRATVKMGIRVIHRTDVFASIGPENFAALVNNQSPPAHQDSITSSTVSCENQQKNHQFPGQLGGTTPASSTLVGISSGNNSGSVVPGNSGDSNYTACNQGKCKKSERTESFPKIRLSPKSFRFSSRFGRSKSEVEKGPSDPFYNYSKSFHEYETCGGPQGAVDKPFLLQEGRVGLRASLDKSWYTHGEDVIVTVNIKNDSRKTVRRMRVCAIQHVDVCMFNNGKFKNIVADTDASSTADKSVGPGNSLNATFILKPQRGPTKNWIALEDSLQRSSEPEEITGCIAASAVKSLTMSSSISSSPDDRNVFAIYVSYYVKVKLTLSGMGGELSLKLPFALVHVERPVKEISPEITESINKLTLNDQLPNRTINIISTRTSSTDAGNTTSIKDASTDLNQIDSIEDDVPIISNVRTSVKRKLIRHSTVQGYSSDEEEKDVVQAVSVESHTLVSAVEVNKVPPVVIDGISDDLEKLKVDSGDEEACQQTTFVQIHATS